jgi:hypothetical protein
MTDGVYRCPVHGDQVLNLPEHGPSAACRKRNVHGSICCRDSPLVYSSDVTLALIERIRQAEATNAELLEQANAASSVVAADWYEMKAAKARIGELEATVNALLESASPHPTEHPRMAAAWAAARAVLEKGAKL